LHESVELSKEKEDKLRKWRDDSLRVDLILKLLENETQNESRIWIEVEKILAKKDQITEFMNYAKNVKEEKLKKY